LVRLPFGLMYSFNVLTHFQAATFLVSLYANRQSHLRQCVQVFNG
jgi:hypothetical protein